MSSVLTAENAERFTSQPASTGTGRPAWMDGGARQDAMAEQIKREIKRQALYRHRRRVEAAVDTLPMTLSVSEPAPSIQNETTSSTLGRDCSSSPAGIFGPTSSINTEDVCRQVLRMRRFDQADSVLLKFYLENILPFLFPFYQPSPLQGNRAWILDLVISSPVVRQAILCQSSYFFALAHAVSITPNSQMWETLLEQARDAFNIMRGNLDVVELVNHMTAVKRTIEVQISHLAKTNLKSASQNDSVQLPEDAFSADSFSVRAETMGRDSALATQIWAHSALLYLSIVVSGWQPANTDVQRHVAQALELLMDHGLSPAVLRTMAWPICVIGCLADSEQRDRIREMSNSLQPPSRFTTMHRGFSISEKVRQDRASGNAGDFSSYFRDESMLILLI